MTARYAAPSGTVFGAPREIVFLPVLVAAPILVLLSTRLGKYAPSAPFIVASIVGATIGIFAWWRNSGPPRRVVLVGDVAAARVATLAHDAIARFDAKAGPRMSDEELEVLWTFYERWLNLEAEARSMYREELAMRGINLVRLGDALRYHGER